MFDGRTKLATEVLEEVHRYFPDRVFADADSAQHPALRSAVVRQAGDSVRREEPRRAGVSLARARARARDAERARSRARPGRAARRRRDERPHDAAPRRDLQQVPLAQHSSRTRTSRADVRAARARRAARFDRGVRRARADHRARARRRIRADRRRAARARGAGRGPRDDPRASCAPPTTASRSRSRSSRTCSARTSIALEEAMGFAHLMEAYAFTQEQVAERVGKSRPSIANALRLLSLPDAVKQFVRDGKLTAGHARARSRAAARAARGRSRAAPSTKGCPCARSRSSRRTAAPKTRARRARAAARERRRRRVRRAAALQVRDATCAIVAQRARRHDRAALRRRGRPDAHRRPAARRRGVTRVARGCCALLAARDARCRAGAAARRRVRSRAPQPRRPASSSATSTRCKARDYDAAFALLTDDERRYFGDAASYRSVFDADGVAIERATIAGARGDERARVFFVRERIAYVDHATDARREVDATVPHRRAARARRAARQGPRQAVPRVRLVVDRGRVRAARHREEGRLLSRPHRRRRDVRERRRRLRDAACRTRRACCATTAAASTACSRPRTGPSPTSGCTKGFRWRRTPSTRGRSPSRRRASARVPRSWTLTVAPALREGADAPFDVTIPIAPQP